MPAGGTSPRFDISDFLTRVIPGSVLVFSVIASAISDGSLLIESVTGSSILMFVITSFVIGEFINTFRVSTLDVPNYFRRVLYSEEKKEEYLGRLDSAMLKFDSDSVSGYSLFNHSDSNIASTLRGRFDLDDSFGGVHNFYTLLTSDLSADKSQQTNRLESIYIFYQNIKFAVIFSTTWHVLYTVLILADVIQQTQLQTAIAFLVAYLLISLFYLIVLAFDLIAPADNVYVESLLSDYFTCIKKDS